jgi:signal transduction histidine kinase
MTGSGLAEDVATALASVPGRSWTTEMHARTALSIADDVLTDVQRLSALAEPDGPAYLVRGDESSLRRLTIDDDGPGIAPADRERDFARWVRLGAAGSRNDRGSGLGLPIAQLFGLRHRAARASVRDVDAAPTSLVAHAET